MKRKHKRKMKRKFGGREADYDSDPYHSESGYDSSDDYLDRYKNKLRDGEWYDRDGNCWGDETPMRRLRPEKARKCGQRWRRPSGRRP